MVEIPWPMLPGRPESGSGTGGQASLSLWMTKRVVPFFGA